MTTHKIPLFKTSITEVDKDYAREQTGCPFIDDLDGMSFVDKSGCLCVWFDGEPDLDTIVHESVHLANMIIDRTGMMYTTKEDELLAYLVSYIFNELRGKDD